MESDLQPRRLRKHVGVYKRTARKWHAPNATYDAAGNQTTVPNLPGASQAYDAENRIVTVTGSGTTTYAYDGDGHRVQKVTSAGTTNYVYDAFGNLVAEYNSAAAPAAPCLTCYLSTDHLGSVRMITDQAGNVVSRHDYTPFGERIPAGTGARTALWGATDNVSQKFTGKERDGESGLDYFGARYYGGSLGRFTSPDPFGGHLDDPQTLNRYAYVRNAPLSLTDPTGMDFAVTGCDPSDPLHCNRNVNTGQYESGQYAYDSNGDLKWQSTQVGNYGTDGGLADKNTGQTFTGSFDQSGIHLTSADGSISGQGQFIHGTNDTAMAGSGQFSGFGAIFNDDCGRTCVAKGSIYPLDSEHSFSDLLSSMIKNPGAEALDFFHPGHANYHFDNGDGPSPHIPYAPGLPYQELHYDAEYPYADISAFGRHTSSALRSILHLVTGPHPLPIPEAQVPH